jgi:hypothetical protein
MERINSQKAQKPNTADWKLYTCFPPTKSGIKFYEKTYFLPPTVKLEKYIIAIFSYFLKLRH